MVSSKSNEGEKLILAFMMEEGIDDYGQRHRQPGGRQRLPPLLLLCLVLPTGGSPDQLLSNVTVDLGQRVELPCLPHNQDSNISWQFSGERHLRLNASTSLITPNSLVIPAAELTDAGLYTCHAENQVVNQIKLEVRTVPSRVTNMSVHTNSVFAIVTWSSPGEEHGLPVLEFICQHRADTSHKDNPTQADLAFSSQRIKATESSCALYRLLPNTTYYFRIAAVNRLGQGEFVSLMGKTRPLVKSLGMVTYEEEDTGYGRVLAICLSVSLLGLVTVGSGIALLTIRKGSSTPPPRPLQETVVGEESLELVPHITLNPSFNIDMLEHIGEEDSSEHAFLVDHDGAAG